MKRRVFPDAIPQNIALDSVENDSFMSVWFLSYCLLVGPAERFIVRTASKSMRTISNEELQEELRACFFQEVKHAESHEVFSDRYFDEHPIIKKFYDFSSFINYKCIDKLAPHALKLSIASAMEQLNSEISYWGLKNVDSLHCPDDFKEMLCWHFVEEIEHREVVFDLLKEVKTGRATYLAGIGLVLFSFSFWITVGAILMTLTKPRTMFGGLFKALGSNGVLRKMTQSSLRYCKKTYHPSVELIPNAFFDYQNKVNVYEKKPSKVGDNKLPNAAEKCLAG